MLFLYVQEAMTRNFPINLQTASYNSSLFSGFTALGLKAIKELVKADKTPIGCAVLGKPSMMFFISSLTKVYFLIWVSKSFNSNDVGNSPKINK